MAVQKSPEELSSYVLECLGITGYEILFFFNSVVLLPSSQFILQNSFARIIGSYGLPITVNDIAIILLRCIHSVKPWATTENVSYKVSSQNLSFQIIDSANKLPLSVTDTFHREPNSKRIAVFTE